MSQRFYVDDLITDSSLLSSIKSFGGDTLRRITSANPCSDTISISRFGDTLKCDDYLWMVLHLNNDTSVVFASEYLTIFHQSSIIIAQPNFYFDIDITPNDVYYQYQKSLHNQLINVERAWDFEVGNYGKKIGIIDNGLDYRHCDLGNGKGIGKKVTGGWNWTENNEDFYNNSVHGTPVAGIIGALTNGSKGQCPENGVAGITGGWLDDNGDGPLGCQLMGFRTANPNNNDQLTTSYIIAAIREASAFNPPYGYGVNILNNSYSSKSFNPALQDAVNYSYEHGVSFVASRGNESDDKNNYPACFSNNKVISVGASTINRKKVYFSSYGKGMDLIAPGDGLLIYTTKYDGGYEHFGGTSAAAPHVSGLVGLLMSFVYNHGWSNLLEPEDFEGILKASAKDMIPQDDPGYLYGYDDFTGWGHLQADNLFNMINSGYRILHYNSSENLQYGSWSRDPIKIYFVNDGRINKPLSTGAYYAYRRKITGIVTLPDNWIIDDEHNLYVWGRSGQGANSGFSAANPNYQIGYTQVLSGTGANSNEWVDGIIHNDLNVNACTYQYDVYDYSGRHYGIYPPNNKIALNISIFGLENSTYMLDKKLKQEKDILVYPNPAKDLLNVKININQIRSIHIKIYNILGIVVFDRKYNNLINNRLTINLSDLEDGSYFLVYSTNGVFNYIKLILY